ncbi:hypothetical protein Golob_026625 [Gossypium lobatum]|uniref:Uncharacterized protein n=1 Tax=Gossypium lobatum TaxID=34289 RepID=A0A7J8LVQ5_9ROSI|nr:hypothetical protein [Gossypium lobatum]
MSEGYNLDLDLSYCPHYTGRYVRLRYRVRHRSVVACSCCSREPSGDYHFYDLSVGQSRLVGRKCVVSSVHDGRNARVKLGDAEVYVEAMNYAATAIPKEATQDGHVREGQQRLGDAAQGAH